MVPLPKATRFGMELIIRSGQFTREVRDDTRSYGVLQGARQVHLHCRTRLCGVRRRLWLTIEQAAAAGAEPRPKIGLLMDTLDERWQRDRDLFLERAQQLDADVLVEAAERDDAQQLQQAQSLLDRGVEALVVIPHSAEKAAEIVDRRRNRCP